ncbi:hypothetical protein POM88_038342 [Heracleum sosnowskyi]|uniref:Importin subunit alpha n=1 Tax=Heracleum sosnowskyi TaxID=360622 RepID=A0AAD8H9E4_9APIA|nr:hypothetical protein POM88_038342 [Heracleum sosnowskyi]
MKDEAPSSVNICMKRVREEELVKIFERKIRDREESVEITFSNELIFYIQRSHITSQFYFSPPFIRLHVVDQQKREKIYELTSCIKTTQGRVEETEELCRMIQTNPKLSNELQRDFIKLLIELLEHEQNPKFQSRVAIILQLVIAYSSSGKVVIDNITDSILVNLIRSEVHQVLVQGLWLLHTIAITYSKFPQEALELLTSIVTDRSTVREVLCVSGRTLAVACQINPELPCDKLKSVVRALMKLLESEHSDIYPSGYAGLVYLCDGRKEMIVENEYFGSLIERFVGFNWCSSENVLDICRAAALGSIVRWGSDDDIDQVIIEDGLLRSRAWLSEKEKYVVKNACWIISNIAARKENHIKAVIDSELIDPLVHIVESYESLDVKKEAAWAISNVIYGAGPDQIEDLRNRCVKPFWNLMKECRENQEIVSLCLEGLVRLQGINITCNDQPIDVVEWFKVFKKFLLAPQTTRFQLAEDIDGLTKLKKLRHIDTIENSDCDMVLHLTCTLEADFFAWRITPETTDQMEVDMK